MFADTVQARAMAEGVLPAQVVAAMEQARQQQAQGVSKFMTKLQEDRVKEKEHLQPKKAYRKGKSQAATEP